VQHKKVFLKFARAGEGTWYSIHRLSVILFSIIHPIVILPSVIFPSVMLSIVILTSVICPSVMLPIVILTSVILPGNILDSVILISVTLLSVIQLNFMPRRVSYIYLNVVCQLESMVHLVSVPYW